VASLRAREKLRFENKGGSAIVSVVKIDFALSAHVRAQELNLHNPHIGVG